MQMNILHISSTDSGGAGLAALRLHKALLQAGVDSHMLVGLKCSLEPTVVQDNSACPWFTPSENKIVRFCQVALRKVGIGVGRIERIHRRIQAIQRRYPAYYSCPLSDHHIEEHSLVQQADIIHLHWIQNFVNFPTFFAQVRKPFVWTLHDLNPFMGGFHHVRLRERYYGHYKKIEDEFCRIKRDAVAACQDLTVVAISQEMEQFIHESPLFRGRPSALIHNSVDSTTFLPTPKQEARYTLGIEAKRVLLFINWNLNDSEKGLALAIKALEQLALPDTLLLCVGEGVIPSTTLNVCQLPPTPDPVLLSRYYSCADLLLFPSYQEAFSQTPMEALCCGTPVVITPVSGAREQIRDFNGYIAADYTLEAFAKAIRQALTQSYNPEQIRNDIIARFSPERIALQYIELYKNERTR